MSSDIGLICYRVERELINRYKLLRRAHSQLLLLKLLTPLRLSCREASLKLLLFKLLLFLLIFIIGELGRHDLLGQSFDFFLNDSLLALRCLDHNRLCFLFALGCSDPFLALTQFVKADLATSYLLFVPLSLLLHLSLIVNSARIASVGLFDRRVREGVQKLLNLAPLVIF